jgi:hypothetical protein
MKKALIIIGAVFGGLILLLLVGAAVGEDTVVVQGTAPEVTAPPEPAITLTAKEQRVYEFIAEKYPKVRAMNDATCESVDDEDASGLDTIQVVIDNSNDFVDIGEEWKELDFVGGEVDKLERDFDGYIDASVDYYMAWLKAADGNTSDAAIAKAVKARNTFENLDENIEAHLAELEEGSY